MPRIATLRLRLGGKTRERPGLAAAVMSRPVLSAWRVEADADVAAGTDGSKMGSSMTGSCGTGASEAGAAVSGAAESGAAESGASETGASVTGAAVTGASVTGAPGSGTPSLLLRGAGAIRVLAGCTVWRF